MFDFMIICNDNGEMKSITSAELIAAENGQSTMPQYLEMVLNKILDDREKETPDETA